MTDIFFCNDMSKKFEIPLDCCNSCHDDFDDGYSSLCEIEIQGLTYQICCIMSHQYDEKNKRIKALEGVQKE